MHHRVFRFVGGPQDGKSLPVPSPISAEMEFLVRPGEPYLPWDSYRLGPDGQFHYVGLSTTVPPTTTGAEAYGPAGTAGVA